MISLIYEELLDEAYSEGLIVKEKYIPGYGGRIYRNRIAIHKELCTSTEKSCVLAEELGHYYTTTGDILDQSDVMNRKQEYRARLWGYNRLIGLMGIINAYIYGCQTLYEMAAYLDVTEEYLREAIFCYRNKYGVYKQVDNYIVYFEPCLKVCEILD